MSKIHVRKLLSDLVAVIKEKTGLTSFTWGELEFLLKYYCAPEEKIDISKVVDGSATEVIIPRGFGDTWNCGFPTLDSSKTKVIVPKSISKIDYLKCHEAYFLGHTSVPVASFYSAISNITCPYVPSSIISNWKSATNWSGKSMRTLSLDSQMNYKHFLTNAVSLLNATFDSFIWNNFKSKLNELFGLESYDNSIAIRYYKKLTTNTDIAEILNNVTRIGDYAFSGCTGLTSITIPDSVTSIGEDAFRNCTGLTKINWNAESVSDFIYNNYTFSNVGTSGDGIDVVFGDNVKSIPAYAFQNVSSVKSVIIGNSVTSIGSSAFWGCTGLTSIAIPDSVTSIDYGVFSGCTSLTSITIGNSVTTIGNYVFDGCTGLTSITIPDSVTSIGSSVFWGCTGLTSVTIGNSVTSIGSWVFHNCTKLVMVDFSTHTAVPTLASANAFENTSSSLAIKVPSALLDEWKTATNWSTYADKIVGV